MQRRAIGLLVEVHVVFAGREPEPRIRHTPRIIRRNQG